MLECARARAARESVERIWRTTEESVKSNHRTSPITAAKSTSTGRSVIDSVSLGEIRNRKRIAHPDVGALQSVSRVVVTSF